MPHSILVLNGPNLNLLGTREPEIYGSATLADVEKLCRETAERFTATAECHQSNHEGELIDLIHAGREKHAAVVINPGAYTHTSIALRDALSGVGLPVYEVHLSNTHAREFFRRRSYISGIAKGVICGLGIAGYRFAVEAALADHADA